MTINDLIMEWFKEHGLRARSIGKGEAVDYITLGFLGPELWISRAGRVSSNTIKLMVPGEMVFT